MILLKDSVEISLAHLYFKQLKLLLCHADINFDHGPPNYGSCIYTGIINLRIVNC